MAVKSKRTYTVPPPHLYKTQRRMEREALAARNEILAQGGTTVPMCGYVYTPSKPKNPDVPFDPTPRHCTRNAGSNTAHHGTGYCDYHDWLVAETLASDKNLQVHAALRIAKENATFWGARHATDPHTALLDEINRTAAIVSWLETHLQELSDDGTPIDAILAQYTKASGIQPSVWMVLYQTERDHLVKTCIAAIKAGVAERKVQIAEAQGRLIAAMMFAFMHDPELGLSPDQMIAAPRLIRKHLMSMPNANPAAVDPQAILASTTARTQSQVIDV